MYMNMCVRVCMFHDGLTVDAQAVLKATNVDGIFDSDPRTNSDASLLTRLTYRRVALEGLSGMDATAITLCEENDLPGIRRRMDWIRLRLVFLTVFVLG